MSASLAARLLLIMAAVVASAVGSASPGVAARLPSVEGQTLTEQPFRIPNDLPASGSIVVVGFDRAHQAFIDNWAGGLGKAWPNLAVVRVAAIDPAPSFVRNVIQFGMRREIPSGEARARTVLVFTDVKALASAMRLPTGIQTPYALAIGTDGEVLAMATGPFSKEGAAPLLSAINAKFPTQVAK